MKKLFPLLFLAILFVSIRVVYAETESLYVDSKTNDLQNWDQRNAPSPYLADESTGFIRETKSSAATEGYFGFVDPSGTGTISSVYLYFECYGEDTNDIVNIYLNCDDGSSFLLVGGITVNQLSYDWESLYLGRLDSWYDIQTAQIYLYYQGVGGGDDIYIRRAYLYVDYTPAGAEYTRDLSQGITIASDSSRTWALSRSLTQTMTTATLSSRIWATSRTTNQGMSLGSDSSRSWSLSRVLTQSLTVSSSVFSDIFKAFSRYLTQGFIVSSDSSRTWSLSRTVSQGMNLASESLRSWTLSRSLTQSMSFASSLFFQLTEGGGTEFLRNLALGMTVTTETMRTWGLSRTITQGLSFTSNSIGQKLLGQLIKRFLSLELNLDSKLAVTLRIVNEFNIPLLIFHIVPLYLSYRWLKEPNPVWSGVGGMMWFLLALLVLQDNLDNYVIVRIYTLFGIIFIMLTLVSVLKQIKDISEGRTDDDFFEF